MKYTILGIFLFICSITPFSTVLAAANASGSSINETFRQNSLDQVDDTLDKIRPANAPDLFNKTQQQALANDRETGGITVILQIAAGFVASIASLVALLNILYNAYLYITSKGDSAKTGKSIKAITWSLLGLVAIIFSYNIVFSIIQFLFDNITGALNS